MELIGVYEGRNVVGVGRRGLVMGVLSDFKISLFPVPESYIMEIVPAIRFLFSLMPGIW